MSLKKNELLGRRQEKAKTSSFFPNKLLRLMNRDHSITRNVNWWITKPAFDSSEYTEIYTLAPSLNTRRRKKKTNQAHSERLSRLKCTRTTKETKPFLDNPNILWAK